MGPENNVGLGGSWITECLLPYLCMVTVPHIMVKLEFIEVSDYRSFTVLGLDIVDIICAPSLPSPVLLFYISCENQCCLHNGVYTYTYKHKH